MNYSGKIFFTRQRVRLLFVFLYICICITPGYSRQDTVRVMGYNLLSYGASDNHPTYKNPRLSTILTHVQPDIFGVNELVSNPAHATTLLEQVLGQGWEKGTFQNQSRQSLTSTLFWKTEKFGLLLETLITHTVRDIVAYRLYYKAPDLAQTRDTAFLTVIMVHLKAGGSEDDEEARAAETRNVINYLNSLGKEDNYLLIGDMNLYSSAEQAYQNLTGNGNPVSRFYDPANRPGDWSGSAEFADIHTQSTRRTSGLGDGGAYGGMDDRFDFILASGPIMQHRKGVGYVPGSYTTTGQDGKRLNKSVNATNPVNTSAPPAVIEALYEMSDHLPVYADFVIAPGSPSNHIPGATGNGNDITVANPFQDDIHLSFGPSYSGEKVRLQLSNMTGNTILDEERIIYNNTVMQTIPVPRYLPPGCYILTITGNEYLLRHKLLRY